MKTKILKAMDAARGFRPFRRNPHGVFMKGQPWQLKLAFMVLHFLWLGVAIALFAIAMLPVAALYRIGFALGIVRRDERPAR